MSTTSDIELTDRLRRTYNAVADSVGVGGAPAHIDEPAARLMSSEPHHRRSPGLIAAALLLVVAGVVGLTVIRSSDPSTSSIDQLASQVRHATLNNIPEGYGLVSIATADDGDVLIFDNGSNTFSITTQHSTSSGLLPAMNSRQRQIRAGRQAFVTTGDISTVRWEERPGITVAIEATDLSVDELVDLALNVVMIGDEVWDQQVASKGFAPIHDAERVAYRAEVIGAESPGLDERALGGSLQEGVNIWVQSSSRTDLGRLDPFTNRWTDNGFIVWTDAEVATVRITGPDVSIAVSPVADPGVPHMKVGAFELEGLDTLSAYLVEYLDEVGNVISTGLL